MKAEYDFSKAERGKFYHPNATFRSPIYLDDQVQGFVMQKAKEQGIDLSDVVNQLLKEIMLSKSQ
ncbi:hypothetical protein IQ241_11415 [Romeria aff. gracilis LEGE 07310]|uniref:Uncharacterized protein n=1 Tax=Vasconcelosia minhoensis LEGE 07310 TaxID=915328 RepID=A0A8J7AHY8_9CYAN|nr:hypothetical protein [Romeria gracilis]MBE9077893.1 hypothetical protein [Romeria aff. gracilis LEGE 07310]